MKAMESTANIFNRLNPQASDMEEVRHYLEAIESVIGDAVIAEAWKKEERIWQKHSSSDSMKSARPTTSETIL